MNRQEIMNTNYGEFLDLLACDAVMNGFEKQKKKRRVSIEEMLDIE